MKLKEEEIAGEDKISINKRRALTHILICLTPKVSSTNPLSKVIRFIVRTIAADELWQFYCLHGRSGSPRIAIAKEMPTTLSCILAAATSLCTEAKNIILETLSIVLRQAQNNRASRAYIQQRQLRTSEIHPEGNERNNTSSEED